MNYSIKQALVEIDSIMQIDTDNDAFKFCVSAVAMEVAGYGLQLVTSSAMSTPLLVNLRFIYFSIIL